MYDIYSGRYDMYDFLALVSFLPEVLETKFE